MLRLRFLPTNKLLLSSCLLLSPGLLLTACGDDGNPSTTDGGIMVGTDGGVDGGPGMMDAGPMYTDLSTCDAPQMVAGEIGTVTVTADTNGGPPGPRDLGPNCGNQSAMRWAPQEVIAYQVPGSGLVGVEFSLVNDGTSSSFDTLVQVRTETCASVPETPLTLSCFDDTDDVRSAGAFSAMGGDTVYLIVTGYAETPVEGASDRGAFSLQITARANDAPDVTGGQLSIIGSRVEAAIEGTDDDGDAIYYIVRYLNAEGEPVDRNDDGTVDDADLQFAGFDPDSVMEMTTFTGTARIDADDIGARLTELAVTQAEVRIVDSVYTIGAIGTIPVVTLNEVGPGETCDAMNVCLAPLTCESDACAVPEALQMVCDTATAIEIETPTDEMTTGSGMGSVGMGDGAIAGSCYSTDSRVPPSPEALFTVTVPDGAFDLIVRTDVEGTAEGSGTEEDPGTDTVLSVRSHCADYRDLACNDDIEMGELRSRVDIEDVEAGTYTVVVELFGGARTEDPVEFAVEVGLRPVLATGATCDNDGVLNRCAEGACAEATCP